jgi:hypothetical protein
MKKIGLLLCLFPALPLNASELNHAVGIGLQYAGVIGYQLNYQNEEHRFRAAIGLLGAAAGYDYLLNQHWSLGLTYTETIRSVYSANINYYPDEPNSGIRLGLDLGHMPKGDGDGFLFSGNTKNVIWFNFGYAL